MGSGASRTVDHVSPLRCPKGYDEDKFKKICVLFDKLDSSGDLRLETEELVDIATLHVQNHISKLKKKVCSNLVMNQSEVDNLNKKLRVDLDTVNKKYLYIIGRYESEINKLEHMTNEEKCLFFKKNVVGDRDFTFDLFFNYVKNKTCDFSNIPNFD